MGWDPVGGLAVGGLIQQRAGCCLTTSRDPPTGPGGARRPRSNDPRDVLLLDFSPLPRLIKQKSPHVMTYTYVLTSSPILTLALGTVGLPSWASYSKRYGIMPVSHV